MGDGLEVAVEGGVPSPLLSTLHAELRSELVDKVTAQIRSELVDTVTAQLCSELVDPAEMEGDHSSGSGGNR